MAFLSPLALIALPLLALPVAIHLLVRRRAETLDFPSLKFLRETPSFRLRPRRVQQPLLLSLRVAALLLLILALARPLLTWSSTSNRTRLILMDASLSMTMRGRAEAAKEQARGLINKMAQGERAAVISFSSAPRVLQDFTTDRNKLAYSLQHYEPTGGAADYDAVLEAAESLLMREPPGVAEIDVISDFQASVLQSTIRFQLNSDAQVSTYAVGTEIERNAFTSDLSVRSLERGVQLSASEIVSDADGRKASRRNWTLNAPQGMANDIEWRTEANGQITGRVRTLEPDDFDGDDELRFAFTPPRAGRILLVDSGTDADAYLSAALGIQRIASHSALERKRELNVSDLNNYSLIIYTLHGAPRADETRALLEYARAGGNLWLFMARDVDSNKWNEFAQAEEGRALPFLSIALDNHQPLNLAAADTDAPQFRALDLSVLSSLRSVTVRAGYSLTPKPDAQVLMRWNDSAPALVSSKIGNGQILLLAASAEHASSDLGMSAAFPAFVSSTVDALTLSQWPSSFDIGEGVQVEAAPQESVRVTDESGRTNIASARELFSEPLKFFTEPGIYRLDFNGHTEFVAFNAPATESQRAVATAEEIKSFFSFKNNESSAARNLWRESLERRRGLWRYLLAASFLLLMTELFISLRLSATRRAAFEDAESIAE